MGKKEAIETSVIDALVLEDFLLDRAALPEGWPELIAAWRSRARSPFARGRSAISEELSTFV